MNRAERRRLARSATGLGALNCLGCDSPLGRKGSPPAEKFELLKGYVHRAERCRSLAVRTYLRATGRI